MDINRQQKAPIYEALEEFKKRRVVPFDVPGHKRGRGNPELVQLLGQKCVELDVNSMKPLDNLCHPVSVIREAEELTADAFGAENAFLMVGGTTSAVQAMILSTCKAGDKIILPRNVHKSALNALVLCGAVPVYVNPDMLHAKLGAYYARYKYDVVDQVILDAITYHTTGRPNMTLMDKIIFVADYIEPNRKMLPEMEEIRKEAFTDLDACVIHILKNTLDYLNRTTTEMDYMTQKTYDFYVVHNMEL